MVVCKLYSVDGSCPLLLNYINLRIVQELLFTGGNRKYGLPALKQQICVKQCLKKSDFPALENIFVYSAIS